MVKKPFSEVWDLIIKHEGDIFIKILGGGFSYTIYGNGLKTTETPTTLTKNNFSKAYDLCPLSGPGEIKDIITGSSYVWAILHDNRITNFNIS